MKFSDLKIYLRPSAAIKLLLLLLPLAFGCNRHKTEAESQPKENADLWYMNSIIYNLDVHVFKDSNGDGVGDFNGLTGELGYIKSLGVDVIWLAPFQPSPGNDDGYDITDYFGIDPKVGTKADFDRFMLTAKKMHIKVLMDIVLNHTSIESPWYQQARADSNSKYFNWYVWSKKRPADYNKGMAFPGAQTETWTYDEVAKRYYFHRFYNFQPDLNFENLQVQQMSMQVIRYWMKQGMDGFRLDAVPFMIDEPEKPNQKNNQLFYVISNIEKEVKALDPDAVLLGEANVLPKENMEYFGQNSSRLQMMFNFYANQCLFYALTAENTSLFKKALQETRKKPIQAQWAWFLRNHDEIDLGRLSSRQRNEVFKAMGPETNMQLYNRGIRRRMAPMVNNMAKLKFCYSLLYGLPGAPVIRYGEEIGMGEDLTLPERLSVRTPMQWNDSLNAGFSSSVKTFRPVINMGDYRYQKVNVAAEEKDPNSLLNVIKVLISVRKQCPQIGLGKWTIMDTGNDKTLAIKYDYRGRSVITAYNFSKDPASLTLKAKELQGLNGLLYGKEKVTIRNGALQFSLKGYGFQWYAVSAGK